MRKITSIVVHHSASPEYTSRETIERWHKDRGFSQIGYHYYICRVPHYGPHTTIGRPVEIMGAHAKGSNDGSIGICLAGDYTKGEPAEDMWKHLLTICRLMMQRYDLTVDDIYGHGQVGSTATACPGYSVEKLREDLRPTQ